MDSIPIMAHISRKSLKRKTLDRISQELIEIIAHTRSRKETKALLEEFLTPTERIMLGKRLAVIYMIIKGYPFSLIETTLKVSPSTVALAWKASKRGAFPLMSRKIASEKTKKEFWESLESILRAGMPPMGKRRWRMLKKLHQ